MSVSGDTLFIGLIILALFLTIISSKVRMLPMRLACAMAWLCLGILVITGTITIFSMSTSWCQILGYLFVTMIFVPISQQFMTDEKHERKVRDQFGRTQYVTSTEWHRKKRPSKPSSSDRQAAYRMQIRGTVQNSRGSTSKRRY